MNPSPKTPEDLERELETLLSRAQDNGIDVAGAWDCRYGDGHPDWDVVVTEVQRREPMD